MGGGRTDLHSIVTIVYLTQSMCVSDQINFKVVSTLSGQMADRLPKQSYCVIYILHQTIYFEVGSLFNHNSDSVIDLTRILTS